jgi:hypothetical protein
MPVACGFIHGTGSALNVSIGFIPDKVEITNWTDGDKVTVGIMYEVVAFTSGSVAIKAGDEIRGLTNTGVVGTVDQVILDSGSWAGGDAAGWLVFKSKAIVGTFGSENAEVNDSGNNDLAVAAQAEKGVDYDTEVAAATGNAAITAYRGDADNRYPPGFTIGSTVSEDGKLLFWEAMASDPIAIEPEVAGNTQREAVW